MSRGQRLEGTAAAALLGAALGFLPAGCAEEPGAPWPSYVDVTEGSGIDFVHEHGGSGQMYFIETNGSGCVFFDYDQDGDQDLYAVQAGPLPGFEAGGRRYPDALFRNRGGLHFEDVTAAAGVGDEGYGMGAVAGDLDDDGWRDLYVYNWGPNVLYHNRGDGTFADATAAAGVGDPGYAGTACLADFDRDGDLDLFVGNYVEFRIEDHQPCRRPPAERSYCSPDAYAAQPDRLFRNDGGLHFTSVEREAGITRTDGKALGSIAFDADDDGDLDLFVANDSTPNHLYRNDSRGALQFTDVSEESGASYDRDGRTQGSMGVCAADLDLDLDLDLIVTNLAAEPNALYVNDGRGHFDDEAYARGMGQISFLDFGWGVRFFDWDHDMDQDLLVINGHLHEQVFLYEGAQEYEQSPRLFANEGRGTFSHLGASAGPFFASKLVGRGLAMADLDDDGDLDFFVNMNDHRAQLVACAGRPRGRWVGLALVQPAENRDAIGARVMLTAGGVTQLQEVRAGGSFASQHDPRLLFGLGDSSRVDRLEIRWPDGSREQFEVPSLDRYHELVRGQGRAVIAGHSPESR